jgi:hypothetical protein
VLYSPTGELYGKLSSCFTEGTKDVPEEGDSKGDKGQETPKDANVVKVAPLKQRKMLR